MANLAIPCLLFLGVFVAGASGDSILCVKCDSRNDKVRGDCQKRPPSASTCYASDVQQYCLKVIEYNADNTQRLFVRDCTSISEGSCTHATPEEIAAGAAAKICYEVCKVDRCNDSVRLAPSSLLISVTLLCLAVSRFYPSRSIIHL